MLSCHGCGSADCAQAASGRNAMAATAQRKKRACIISLDPKVVGRGPRPPAHLKKMIGTGRGPTASGRENRQMVAARGLLRQAESLATASQTAPQRLCRRAND